MISDEELRRGAREWEEARLERLPEPEDCRFETSPEFERKMRKLIERTDRPARYWLKRSAACLLLIACLCGSVLALSSGARAAFFGWTREVFDSFFEYRYTGENAPAPENVIYRPAWIPDGFEVYRETYWETEVHIVYLCGGERLAHFSYFMNDEGVDMHIVGGDPELRRVRVGKYPADLYLDRVEGENNSLVWFDGERNALFAISAPAGGEELIRMAESVTDVERPKEEPG